MGQPQSAQQPKDRRVKNFSEVSLGYSKAVSQTEARRCPQCAQPTCKQGCPIGVEIPQFIRALREGDAVAALAKIKESNPFPGVCGRICMAPCETACVFHDEDASIGIRALERYASDNGRVKAVAKTAAIKRNGKKVAIIGSGPSGLAAAAVLAQKGFEVTVLEALAQAGGKLRYGVPEFRLPSRVLDAEIADIQALGVEIRTNVVVGPMTDFKKLTDDFDAVLLAAGTGSPKPSGISGDHLIGVYFAQEFLIRVNLLGAANYPKTPTPALLGNKVVIIGSGFAAVDCARMAIRMGKKVSIVFPGMEEELTVHSQDRKDAVEEGVRVESLTRPLEIIATAQHAVAGIKCERLDFTDDVSGKWHVKTVPGSEFILEADTVILASGSTTTGVLKQFLPGLRFNNDGTVCIDPQSGITAVDKIFAAGNCITGAGPIVDAIASGKRSALAIERYLNGIMTQIAE